MELNEDGLIPGQPVDFETVMRLSRKPKKEAKDERAEEAKPAAKRGRKSVAQDDKSGMAD